MTGASGASCWPTTVRRTTRRPGCRMGRASSVAAASTSRPGGQRRSRPARHAGASRATSGACCVRSSRTASSTATPTATTTREIDRVGHERTARRDRRGGRRAAAETGRRAAARRARLRSLAVIGEDADRERERWRLVEHRAVRVVDAREGDRRASRAERIDVRYDDGTKRPCAERRAPATSAIVVIADPRPRASTSRAWRSTAGPRRRRPATAGRAGGRPRTAGRSSCWRPAGRCSPVARPRRGDGRGLVPGRGGRPGDRAGALRRRRPGGRLPATFPRCEERPAYSGEPQELPGRGRRSCATRRASSSATAG